MFQLGKPSSQKTYSKRFCLQFVGCKGACCVDGDAGAPLSVEETKILEEIYPKVKPFYANKELLSKRKELGP
jgi:hypothetical protein